MYSTFTVGCIRSLVLKILSTSTFVFILTFSVQAHPGIGLVYDGNSTIYYTDLNHIWKLDTETGETSIFLKNIHSHELWLDDDGSLYGEHYWYDEPNQVFKHYIWMATSDGKLSRITDTIVGENDHFSFVRNSRDQSFRFVRSTTGFDIIQMDSTSDGLITTIDLHDPAWMFIHESSNLFVADYPSLHLISLNDTSHTILSDNLTDASFPFSFQNNHHHIYGVWTDADSNVYVALYGGRKVVRIDENLNQETVLKTSLFWSPINGVFDSENNLWLMEASLLGKVRIRKATI